jgi:hypothetical protein
VPEHDFLGTAAPLDKPLTPISARSLSISFLSPIIECLISPKSPLWRYGATVSTRPFQG